MDVRYNSLRGAKIAFSKYFGERAWRGEVQSQWTHTYPPDNDWISEKLDLLEKYSRENPRVSF